MGAQSGYIRAAIFLHFAWPLKNFKQMKKWVIKAVVQKCISFLPYKHQINYLFQKYVTKGVQLSEYYFEDRLVHFGQHHTAFRKYQVQKSSAVVLELGTGWYPVIPIGFFLSGAEKIYTIDISALTNKDKMITTLQKFTVYRAAGKLDQQPFLAERWQVLEQVLKAADTMSMEAILEQLRINYLVADARNLDLPDHSIDLITSNNTFEHVYPEVLKAILQEFRRLLAKDGLMSHFIDMSDHFAHLDQQITIYNFLQFSEAQWQWIDNSIQPQNRWRIHHFRALYEDLSIPISEEINRTGDLNALESIKVDTSFQHISKADLAVSHSYVISDFKAALAYS